MARIEDRYHAIWNNKRLIEEEADRLEEDMINLSAFLAENRANPTEESPLKEFFAEREEKYEALRIDLNDLRARAWALRSG